MAGAYITLDLTRSEARELLMYLREETLSLDPPMLDEIVRTLADVVEGRF